MNNKENSYHKKVAIAVKDFIRQEDSGNFFLSDLYSFVESNNIEFPKKCLDLQYKSFEIIELFENIGMLEKVSVGKYSIVNNYKSTSANGTF